MDSLRIISWNLLHSVGAVVDDIATLIENEKPDLFVMQEVTDEIDALPNVAGGYYLRQPWPTKKHGLAVWCDQGSFLSSPLKLPASNLPGKLPRRLAQVLEFNGITIANVHLSHGQFLNRRQLGRIARSTSGPTAIIGDYNALGPVILKEFSDVGPKQPTHRAQNLIPFRLDRCLVRGLRCSKALSLHRGASDHHPILVELQPVKVSDRENRPELVSG